jgi:hypothetical protein
LSSAGSGNAAGKAGGGAGGNAGHAGSSGGHTGGSASGGKSGGTGGATTGGSATGGSGGVSAKCKMIQAEYAAELEKQLGCNPSAANQCTGPAVIAAGCECEVFIQPADPFAIENLSNYSNAWFNEDCGTPICPTTTCSNARKGTCKADSKSSLGGRCTTP